MERIQKGEGDVGRLLTDETLVRDVEAIVAKASGTVSDLGQLVSELQLAASNVKNLSQDMNARDGGVPALLRRADATLATLQQSMRSACRPATPTSSPATWAGPVSGRRDHSGAQGPRVW
ncbi:MAG TPA: hypothetical protein VNZ53_00860 [Steroidobacteraceae bacterium]|nr:hypothetical protein [Steroidobacteraceae bacterium]